MATDSIGTRIARRRQRLGLSQADLADRVGVSESSVVNWEKDKHYPRRHLGKLEFVLGVSLTEAPAPESLSEAEQEAWKALAALKVPEDKRWETIIEARQRLRAAPAPGREAG